MKQELKFRAWNATDKVMITPDMPFIGAGSSALNVCITLDGKQRTPNAYNLDYGFEAPMPELEFMLCTGLKDKNSAYVFRGDILSKGDELFTVDWHHCQFMLNKNEWLIPDNLEDFEIVGNIFQNPDLLKVY